MRAAITQVYEAQSYSTGDAGLAKERARLDLLTQRESQLETKLARARRGGGIGVSYIVPER